MKWSAETLLGKTLPRERVSQIMEEIRGPAGRTMWDKLGNVNEDVLANYLKNEYPQTVAGRIVENPARARRARPDHVARRIRHGSRHAHVAHGDRAERGARRCRAHVAGRVHVESRTQRAASRSAHELGDGWKSLSTISTAPGGDSFPSTAWKNATASFRPSGSNR